jgi:hypothetical protein
MKRSSWMIFVVFLKKHADFLKKHDFFSEKLRKVGLTSFGTWFVKG